MNQSNDYGYEMNLRLLLKYEGKVKLLLTRQWLPTEVAA